MKGGYGVLPASSKKSQSKKKGRSEERLIWSEHFPVENYKPMDTKNTTQINSAAVIGELGTGYEDPEDKGPFECGNCKYFSSGTCGQSDMMARSKRPKDASGRIKVDQDGCCDYVDRGENDASDDDDTEEQEYSPGSQMMSMGGQSNG